MRSSLILLDGVWGSGKTTYSKKIHAQLLSEGVNAKLFLDDKPGHPLQDTERLSSEDFYSHYYERVSQAIDKIKSSNEVVVMESLVINGLGFEATLEEWSIDKYQERLQRVNSLLSSIPSLMIFFHNENMVEHWDYISKARTETWVDIVKSEFRRDEEGLINLLTRVQDNGHTTFDLLNFRKGKINMSRRDWDHIDFEVQNLLCGQ